MNKEEEEKLVKQIRIINVRIILIVIGLLASGYLAGRQYYKDFSPTWEEIRGNIVKERVSLDHNNRSQENIELAANTDIGTPEGMADVRRLVRGLQHREYWRIQDFQVWFLSSRKIQDIHEEKTRKLLAFRIAMDIAALGGTLETDTLRGVLGEAVRINHLTTNEWKELRYRIFGE